MGDVLGKNKFSSPSETPSQNQDEVRSSIGNPPPGFPEAVKDFGSTIFSQPASSFPLPSFEHCVLIDDVKEESFKEILKRSKNHRIPIPENLTFLKHIEIPEAERRQGRAGRLLKRVLKEKSPRLITSIPLSNLPALKLMRSLYQYFWPVFVTWRGLEDQQPEVIFLTSDTLEDEREFEDEFLRSLSLLAQSSLASQPVRVISILFDIAHKRGVMGHKQISDLSKIIDLGDWKRLGQYVHPGCHNSLVGDLWPIVSHLILCGDITKENQQQIDLPPFQRASFIGIGLQHKTYAAVGREYEIPAEQVKIQFKIGLGRVKKYAELSQLNLDEMGDPLAIFSKK